ncbi:uncharacterized protein METZ01_LOCUS57002 [marine metagenome]|uniref:Uncharacterized protein n=1 Tax=marine metagenome TaxID=408172 RepID=A0A381SLJ3_9ZZZZ
MHHTYLISFVNQYRPVAQFWLERRIDIAKVDGSSPFGSTTFWRFLLKQSDHQYELKYI